MRKISTAIVALATLAFAAPASAGEIWLRDGWPYNGSATDSGDWIFTGSDGVSARVSAWAIHGDEIHQGSLGVYTYGLGVSHGSDDHHTIDNRQYQDFLLFQFDQSVMLDTALFVSDSDWGPYDTDATIGYLDFPSPYTDALPLHDEPASTLDLLNLYDASSGSGVIDTDWVGGALFSTRNINPGDHVGNFWLIGASFADRYFDGSKDGFKLKKLTYTVPPPSVPEPGTWLMMILGFGLVGGMMRREKRKDAPALA